MEPDQLKHGFTGLSKCVVYSALQQFLQLFKNFIDARSSVISLPIVWKQSVNSEMAKVHRDVLVKKSVLFCRLDFSKDYRIEATYAEHQQILQLILGQYNVTAALE